MKGRNWSRRPMTVLGILAMLSCMAYAKTITGTAALTGSKPEHLVFKFAVSPRAHSDKTKSPWPTISGTLTSKGLYMDDRSLKLYMYSVDPTGDDHNVWSSVKNAATCREKAKLANLQSHVSFDIQVSGSGDDDDWEAHVGMKLVDKASYRLDSSRPRYWYVVLADCGLESFSTEVQDPPKIDYTITIMDINKEEYTHLPYDEQGMESLNLWNLGLSLLLVFGLAVRALQSLRQRGSLHVAVLVVASASGLSALASLCEVIHLQSYRRNGVGSFLADALSAHLEAAVDSLIALILLAVAVGWTLPSDITVRVDSDTVGSGVTKMLQHGLRQGHTSTLALALIGSHAFLAQWGRTYDDDFDCYHDLEHLPGKVLFALRLVLGFSFLLAIAALKRNTHCSPKLQTFLVKFACIGLAWFVSLPSMAWLASAVLPPYSRHPAVSSWAAVVQMASLVSLTWLFTADSSASAFHSISKASGDSDTMDSLDSTIPSYGPSKSYAFKVGNAKVRMD